MMKRRVVGHTLVAGVLLLTFTPQLLAEILLGRVIHVADGDTLTIVDGKKQEHEVTLSGIDAPERGQPYGRASSQHLARLVAGKQVVVDYYKQDRRGRLAGKAFFNCKEINVEQIQAGLAWHDKNHWDKHSSQERTLYASAESEARRGFRGLWLEPNPIAPWDWRRSMRVSTSIP